MPEKKTPIKSDGWQQWSQLSKEGMDKLEAKVTKLEDKITVHREESLVAVSTLKAKAGIMGVIAGFVVSTVMSLVIGLLVWQLTVGSQPKNIYVPIPPIPEPIEQPVGFILPNMNQRMYFTVGDREDIG